jgi:DUF1680 family protein
VVSRSPAKVLALPTAKTFAGDKVLAVGIAKTFVEKTCFCCPPAQSRWVTKTGCPLYLIPSKYLKIYDSVLIYI